MTSTAPAVAASSSPASGSTALLAMVDDHSPVLQYTGPWAKYEGDSGTYDATPWSGGTFSSCGFKGAGNETGCTVRYPFSGTYAAVFGDANPDHGVVHCSLERTNASGGSEPEGLWAWYFTGAQSNRRPYSLNKTICAVEGIPQGEHTLVLGVEPEQVSKGVAIDYFVSSSELPAGTNYSWSSYFNSAVPPNNLRDTTATPFLPSSTSSASPTSPISSSSGGGGVNKLAVGLGAGLGGACLLIAVGVAVWLFLRRRRPPSRPSPLKEVSQDTVLTHDIGSTWFPDRSESGTMANPRESESPEKGRQSGTWQGFEESPPSSFGFGGRAGYAPVQTNVPYGPPARTQPSPASDSPQAYLFPTAHPSTTFPPSASGATDYAFMDLPRNAALADPDEFHERR
ncbi:hypothetical protein JCM10213v2_004508 [Rhodosporidiobolus nylandii]